MKSLLVTASWLPPKPCPTGPLWHVPLMTVLERRKGHSSQPCPKDLPETSEITMESPKNSKWALDPSALSGLLWSHATNFFFFLELHSSALQPGKICKTFLPKQSPSIGSSWNDITPEKENPEPLGLRRWHCAFRRSLTSAPLSEEGGQFWPQAPP